MRLLNEIRNYMGNYHVKSGVYHYQRNEFQQAIGFLRKALSDEPATLNDADRANARRYLALSHKGLGEKLAAGGDLEAGIEELRRASEVHPDYPDVYFRTAGLLEQLGRPDEAIRAYRKAISGHPGYLEARVALAHCLLSAGRLKEAARAFEQAFKLRLERLRQPFRTGIERLGEGQPDVALNCFHEVFRAAPQLAEEHSRKGLEWLRAEEHERALADFDRAIECNPKYSDLHNLRGIVLCELDRVDEAISAFRRSAELCPGYAVPRLNLAFAHLRAGRTQEAQAELESILESEPEEPVAAVKLEELRGGRVPDKRNSGART